MSATNAKKGFFQLSTLSTLSTATHCSDVSDAFAMRTPSLGAIQGDPRVTFCRLNVWPMHGKIQFIFKRKCCFTRLQHCVRKRFYSRRLRRAPIKIILIEELCKCFEFYSHSNLVRSSRLLSLCHHFYFLRFRTRFRHNRSRTVRFTSNGKEVAKRCFFHGKQTGKHRNVFRFTFVRFSLDFFIRHECLSALLFVCTEEEKVASDDISSTSVFFCNLLHRIQFCFSFIFSFSASKQYTQVPLRSRRIIIICAIAGRHFDGTAHTFLSFP